MQNDKEKRSVLVVDDQDNWRNLLADILLDEYAVTVVADYDSAFKALTYQSPLFHVAIVDIRLDDTDPNNEQGLAFVRALKSLEEPINVIMLTGYPTIRTARKVFRELQVFDYLEKVPEDGGGFNLAGFRRSVREAADDIETRRSQKRT